MSAVLYLIRYRKYWFDSVLINLSYWSLQDEVSSVVKKTYRDRDWNTGRIHGCIVDIDSLNHVYINPFDGGITVYYAESSSSRTVYKLTDKIQNRLPNYGLDTADINLNAGNKASSSVMLSPKDGLFNGIEFIKDNSTIYPISHYFSCFRVLYDKHIVIYWQDSILKTDR